MTHSLIIYFQHNLHSNMNKAQPLKNGSRYENAFSRRNERLECVDAINVSLIPHKICFIHHVCLKCTTMSEVG